jgi:hypothetical protein
LIFFCSFFWFYFFFFIWFYFIDWTGKEVHISTENEDTWLD